TSKDFRFRQRVWYLKDGDTLCNGCSTGCNVKAYYNREGFFRVKPVYNEKVNGYWMCDDGRDVYKYVNRETRWLKAKRRLSTGWEESQPGAAAKQASESLKAAGANAALVLTGQYTVEEYEHIVGTFVNDLKSKNIFHWNQNPEKMDEFDGILLRGDKNPNTQGLLQVLKKFGISTKWSDLTAGVANGTFKTVVVAGPEVQMHFPDFKDKVKDLSKAQNLIWMQSGKNEALEALTGNVWLIPMKSYVEKDGTFVNYAGLAQKFKKVTTVVSEALTLSEASDLLTGKTFSVKPELNVMVEANRPPDRIVVEHRKKNEFVYKRGTL
ncbi:MAG: 2Fe-2S iron-sulfur cluster-binding protein, partial [Pseudobdellovibrionaceae bacterium]